MVDQRAHWPSRIGLDARAEPERIVSLAGGRSLSAGADSSLSLFLVAGLFVAAMRMLAAFAARLAGALVIIGEVA